MSKKQKNYTAEFKTEVIKAIEENNGNVSETARQLAYPFRFFQIGTIKPNLEH